MKFRTVMKLSEMPIGSALILRKEKGINDTFDAKIKEGDLFVEVRVNKDSWIEYCLAVQPKDNVPANEIVNNVTSLSIKEWSKKYPYFYAWLLNNGFRYNKKYDKNFLKKQRKKK